MDAAAEQSGFSRRGVLAAVGAAGVVTLAVVAAVAVGLFEGDRQDAAAALVPSDAVFYTSARISVRP